MSNNSSISSFNLAMRHFLSRTFIFITPFIFWLLVVLLIDPYNFLSHSSGIIDNQVKTNISYRLNYPLFKLIKYQKHPTQYILLGDSRTNSMDIKVVKEISSKDFTNLAYGGGTLKEVIKTFWQVAKDTGLKEVYVGVNFNLYNKINNMDRVSEATTIMEDFFSYSLCSYTVKSTFLILETTFLGISTKIGVPNSSKEQFWENQLTQINLTYGPYIYPDNYFEELRYISEYCIKNKIKLIFFIPPTHIDLQKKVHEFNLQGFEMKFKNDLKMFGDVYDFDYPSDLTKTKDNFSDPFHCTPYISMVVINEIFGKTAKVYCKFSKCTTPNLNVLK
jgi:hypothetical protein